MADQSLNEQLRDLVNAVKKVGIFPLALRGGREFAGGHTYGALENAESYSILAGYRVMARTTHLDEAIFLLLGAMRATTNTGAIIIADGCTVIRGSTQDFDDGIRETRANARWRQDFSEAYLDNLLALYQDIQSAHGQLRLEARRLKRAQIVQDTCENRDRIGAAA